MTTQILVKNTDRDTIISNAFLKFKTIAKTEQALKNKYSNYTIYDVVTNSDVFKKLQNTDKKNNHKKRRHLISSKVYDLEKEMQTEIEKLLTNFFVTFRSEANIPGSQMRADFIGKEWLLEVKVNSDSQSMLTAISQCLVYANILNKKHKAIVIPDDVKPLRLFKLQCKKLGINIIHISEVINWVQNNDRR